MLYGDIIGRYNTTIKWDMTSTTPTSDSDKCTGQETTRQYLNESESLIIH